MSYNFGTNIFHHEDATDAILHIKAVNQNQLKTPLKHLYLIFKLEHKIEQLLTQTDQKDNVKFLIKFYNLVLFNIQNKQNSFFVEKNLLGQLDILSKLKPIAPEIFFQFLQAKYKKQRTAPLK